MHWVFAGGHGLTLVAANGGSSSLLCTDFSLQCPLLLWNTGEMQVAGAVDTNALARKYSFCTKKAEVVHIMSKVATES